MAKIPESELLRLKRDISLVRLVEGRGVKLRGQGDNLLGLCPFHDDKEPSFVVSPAKNVWHCLGACKTGGSVIDFVMKAEKASFRLAVEMLRKQAPALAASGSTSIPKTKPRLEVIAPYDADEKLILRRVVEHYHQALKESPEALAYLASRGLDHPELVSTFKLGFANRTLGYRLPQKQIQAGEALREKLMRVGIYRDSGHEHMTGCLTIPVLGEDGEVLELYGRKVRDTKLPKGSPKHLYLPRHPGERRGVFIRPGLSTGEEVILCEALIDALTFWCAGFRNVTSAYGTQGFTPELREAIESSQVKKVLIAYDRDEAGDRAAEALAKELGRPGLQVFRVQFPKGMDANAYALKVTPASKSLETALRSAVWMAGTRPVPVSEALHTPSDEVIPTELEPEAPHDPVTGELLDAPATSSAPVSSDASVPGPPSPSLAASSAPASPAHPEMAAVELDEEVHGDEIRFRFGPRRWRIRGLVQNTSHASLRVNLLVAQGERFFVDTLDLYGARHRAAFLKEAASELDIEERILKSDLGRVVLRLEDLVHAQLEAELEKKEAFVMSPEDQAAAMTLLKDPDLFSRILEAFETAGVVGEQTNKLVSYLAAVSRKLDSPLAVVFQSSSAAGKSSLMDAALRFVPDEERVHYSAMTGQSLFYMGEQDLAHKVLAISEEEGAHSASYALKLLQSEGQLTIASTGKDPTSGRLKTHEYEVKGPVAIFLTTTALEVDEELLNRCLVLTVDEGQGQTAAIHARQRRAETLEGLLEKRRRDRAVALHQNAQRLIEPIRVINPYAESLSFSSHVARTRRDHAKYLALIRAVTLLHQHQRPVSEIEDAGEVIRYVEVSPKDIELANQLAEHVLAPNLDEIPPQTRKLLGLIEAYVNTEAKRLGIAPEDVRFTRKELRTATRFGHSALKKHLHRLEELEHLFLFAGGARRQLVYGLASHEYDANWSPQNGLWSPPGHPLVTPGGCPDVVSDSEDSSDLVTVSRDALLPAVTNAPRVVRSPPPKNGEARGRHGPRAARQNEAC